MIPGKERLSLGTLVPLPSIGCEISYALRDPKLNGGQLPGLYRSGAKSCLNILLYFAFVLRDMKLNKVQFPWFVRGFCKRKAPLTSCRFVQPSPTFRWTVGRWQARRAKSLQKNSKTNTCANKKRPPTEEVFFALLLFVYSTTMRSFGYLLRTSQPSSVTRTRSSTRTPNLPGR